MGPPEAIHQCSPSYGNREEGGSGNMGKWRVLTPSLGCSSAMASAGVSSAAASPKRYQVRTKRAHKQHQERRKTILGYFKQ
ncbi:hypothetical protein MDA_GLEAN10013314 [Myotis davidii]|uniref:Uncharacterized protein n=1 Tax=Myotis davidii TaxID=225400 RepID=L5M0S6_MYODS|nr:hypothetical protein MDA_GLEAN10013314 [Myotis davidii]